MRDVIMAHLRMSRLCSPPRGIPKYLVTCHYLAGAEITGTDCGAYCPVANEGFRSFIDR
jgi:hypothetical protein